MIDIPSDDPAESATAKVSITDQIAALKADGDLVSEATHRHLEEVVKPSLLPTPNSGEDVAVADGDAPSSKAAER